MLCVDLKNFFNYDETCRWSNYSMQQQRIFFTDTDQNGIVDQIVNRGIGNYQNHKSILRMKEKTKNLPSFGCTHVNPWEISEQIDALNTNKTSSGSMRSKVLRDHCSFMLQVEAEEKKVG